MALTKRQSEELEPLELFEREKPIRHVMNETRIFAPAEHLHKHVTILSYFVMKRCLLPLSSNVQTVQAAFALCLARSRSLDLDIIGFPVLTPLPGTDLMEETKDRLITTNYDFFDFFHTLLPTKLPLGEFYRELANLYRHARPLKNQLRLLKKYPIRQLPSLLRKHNAILNRLKTLDQDY